MIMKNQSNRRQRLNFLLLTYPQPAGAAFATYVSKLRIDILVSLEKSLNLGKAIPGLRKHKGYG